jgi:protein-S-isoprenylcysteine O-methyltransferase Ste14
MTGFILSRNLFCALSLTFIVIRVFFTIKFRKAAGLAQNSNKNNYKENKSNFLVRRFIIIPLLIISIWVYFILNPPWMQISIIPIPRTILWIVTIVGFISCAFLTWVHLCLGKEWSANLELHDGHTLIKSGPYSKIRHPMYTALFAIYLCIALISCNFFILFFFISAIISLIIRLPEEEKMLITEFGDAYKSYMLKTGIFLPKF